jgi:hypothetical protein
MRQKLLREQIRQMRLRTAFRLRILVIISLVLIGGTMAVLLNLSTPLQVKAATETLSTGSYIINMGVTPQTYANGMKPYGMVYDLMVNYNVPIKWVIEPTKVKDGADFTYSGTQYKGGTFIIPAEYISTTISNRITYWNTQGVVGTFTTAAISVPVFATLTNFPNIIIDTVSGNENIIEGYVTNAGIPLTSVTEGSPSLATNCNDVWVNPHGDPTWATHGYLYNLSTVAKTYIWMECHAVSVTEGIKNSASPFEQLNFLTTNGLKCYSNNKCGTTITENHGNNPTTPYTHNYPSDPIMQFMGTMSGATNGGSEKWYQPQSTGGWRATTKRLVTTSDGSSPNEGVLMAYGPAFGNAGNGYVMYEAGHDLDGSGTTAERVAAQRAFLNYCLVAGNSRQMLFSNITVPTTMMPNDNVVVKADVSGGSGNYIYHWTSNLTGGWFSNPNAKNTVFHVPNSSSITSGIITLTVNDDCSRKNFLSTATIINPILLPITLKKFTGAYENGNVLLKWTTSSEINNSYFTLEKSNDGINYSFLAKVNGNGNSTHDIDYEYLDENPEGQRNYYRLKQTDYDGKSETFDPVVIKTPHDVQANEILSAGPNPFSENIAFRYRSEKNSIVEITLINSTGAVVAKNKSVCNAGINSIELTNLEMLPTGIYYALILNGEEKKIVKLFKS